MVNRARTVAAVTTRRTCANRTDSRVRPGAHVRVLGAEEGMSGEWRRQWSGAAARSGHTCGLFARTGWAAAGSLDVAGDLGERRHAHGVRPGIGDPHGWNGGRNLHIHVGRLVPMSSRPITPRPSHIPEGPPSWSAFEPCSTPSGVGSQPRRRLRSRLAAPGSTGHGTATTTPSARRCPSGPARPRPRRRGHAAGGPSTSGTSSRGKNGCLLRGETTGGRRARE